MRMITFISALALLLWIPSTQADDGYTSNLKIFGTIIGESCEVDVNSQEQTVDLGAFDSNEFPTIGTTTSPTPFKIDLKNCSKAINGTKVWFSGTPDTDDPTLLMLSDTGKGTLAEMATGVAVEILDADNHPVSINNAESTVYPLVEGDNVLTFYLRYKSTRPEVTTGNATAIMYFDLLYQ